MNSYHLKAIQVADAIGIAAVKESFTYTLSNGDTDELFYEIKENSYCYVFKYGVVCFFNLSGLEQEELIQSIYKINHYSITDLAIQDEVYLMQGATYNSSYDSICVPDFKEEYIRLIMLQLSQSVALDHYSVMANSLLEDTRSYTTQLEHRGKLDISGKRLKRFIGKVLNIKNKISENLYIFDTPDQVWDDAFLEYMNADLIKRYDLRDRYRTLEMQLNIVKENLDLFKDIMFHKESSKLEWIIILLILVEVVDMFVLRLI